jgi:hypothetical protein
MLPNKISHAKPAKGAKKKTASGSSTLVMRSGLDALKAPEHDSSGQRPGNKTQI